ncbi:hypothetical protein BH10CHL1_BH10CHL1_07890 [soil metagenome]
MSSILFVTRAVPVAIGPGGKHRTYQIEYELKSLFGAERVHTLSLVAWQRARAAPTAHVARVTQILRAVQWRASQYWKNPLGLLHQTGYSARAFTPTPFVARYAAMLSTLPQPVITVIDDARFAGIVAVNRQRHIPTVACLHNLESLDLVDLARSNSDQRSVWRLHTHLVDLANEVQVLRQCCARFFISKVETGFVSGLGLDAGYHPYLPVGAIRERLETIRRRRAQTPQDPNLFLMLGSAMHAPTQRAFNCILAQVQAQGLPSGIRLVLVGMDTDKLSVPALTGVETRGWVDQPELDQLLVSATAVLVPQLGGFGAVTRLVELSCAAVPALVAQHPTLAINLPPGIHVLDGALDNAWPMWRTKISELSQTPQPAPWDFAAWAERQPRALLAYLAQWV